MDIGDLRCGASVASEEAAYPDVSGRSLSGCVMRIVNRAAAFMFDPNHQDNNIISERNLLDPGGIPGLRHPGFIASDGDTVWSSLRGLDIRGECSSHYKRAESREQRAESREQRAESRVVSTARLAT